jgi:hypothetical protein
MAARPGAGAARDVAALRASLHRRGRAAGTAVAAVRSGSIRRASARRRISESEGNLEGARPYSSNVAGN